MEDLLTLGYIGLFIFSFILNLIPFLSPSNIVIAGAAGSLFPQLNLLIVGILLALAASIAKTIHFGVSFFASNLLHQKKMEPNGTGAKLPFFPQLGMIALFLAAITPIPDDPVVIPLGLAKYNPIKFFTAYFSGKVIVTVTGTFIGQTAGSTIKDYFGGPAAIVISVILTVLIIIVLFKKEWILTTLGKRGS